MPNYLDPNSGDEASSGDAYDVNDAGAAVGYGSGIWQHGGTGIAYGNAAIGVYKGANFITASSIDDSGTIIVPGFDFDHGDVDEHYGTLIYPYGEMPGVDSASDVNIDAEKIHGGFVVGTAIVNGQHHVAFVWKVGDARATELPDPDQYNSFQTMAVSVNNAGDVAGWGAFTNSGSTSYKYVIWKRNSFGGYNAFLLDDTIADQSLAQESENGNVLINDNGDIAFEHGNFYTSQKITVISPAKALLTVTDTNGFLGSTTVNQADGFATAVVTLQRSSDYAGPVSVSYFTTPGTAVAGIRYTNVSGTLTWNAGDSANKTIKVPLVNGHAGVQEEDFNLTLTNAVNAIYGNYGYGSNLDIYIADNGGMFTFTKLNYSVADSWTNAVLVINRTGGADGSVTLAYQTYDDTALNGTDYTATNGTLTWASGDASSRQIVVPITKKGTGTNVDFDAYFYVQSSDSGNVQTGDGDVVTITRPGHPVSPTIAKLNPPSSSATLPSFELDATQGGIFDIQSTTNFSDPTAWKTIFTFTNTSGNVQIPTGFSILLRGQFYRLQAR
ncbi:MAG: Calx-beta domain-containing protein [Limisphaerales bacterium]